MDTDGRKSQLQKVLMRMGPDSGVSLCLDVSWGVVLQGDLEVRTSKTPPSLGLPQPKTNRMLNLLAIRPLRVIQGHPL